MLSLPMLKSETLDHAHRKRVYFPRENLYSVLRRVKGVTMEWRRDKISEKLLLEKCSPKTKKLEEIKTLDLSKLDLTLQDLPVKLLSRLKSLERLDLSQNRLQELPRNLELPNVRFLDLSDNQMEDVTTLEGLGGLEELKMEDNLYITVSDNYKMMVSLPNLRLYNGKDITTTANHVRFVFTDNLRTRVIAHWEKDFSLPDPMTEEKISTLETKFVNSCRQVVKYGPNSVSDFTKWKVEILAKEYLRSLTHPLEGKEKKQLTDIDKISSPTKRKQPASEPVTGLRLTPRKKLRAEPSSPAIKENPHKYTISLKPSKKVQENGTALSPRRTERCPATPTKASLAAETTKNPSKKSHTKNVTPLNVEKTTGGFLPKTEQPVKLKPLHVLQCHSKQDNPEDLSTQLWACAFQPLPDSTVCDGGTRLVATCGGDSVCVIDCETGMVMKKYKVSGEEFFSLCWTTVLMSVGGGAAAKHCSVLAAGGKKGIVKLIHPRNNIAYGEFRASRKSLSVLRFNHQQGNFLFTGSYDNKIVMWDIGGVDSTYNYKVVQLLMLDSSATPLHLCLPPSSPNTHLLSASEDGLHCYKTQLGTKDSTKRTSEMEITFPIYKQENKDSDFHTIDGLSFLTDDIVASKNFMHSSIYLWSWSRTQAQRPDKNKTVSAVVLAELQWAATEIPYLALNTCPGRAYVACGDDKGGLWMYHVKNLEKHLEKPIVPTEMLKWPCPLKKGLSKVEGPSINNVAMDPDLQYLVALSDKNMVIVWKREKSS
ncbi:LOW QUALITY PROTEIN: leucine-rich repeat and WD repeat-containing protein 1 [Neosynchiropus ocellatus]